MTTAPLPADVAAIVEAALRLLADGGRGAASHEVGTAFDRIDTEVTRRLREGARGVDAAFNDTAQVVCDRTATRLLQNRPLDGALHDVAVLHALLELGYPARWFEVSALDDVDLAPRAQNGR